jgi:nicotinate phosphoribosyltransferase
MTQMTHEVNGQLAHERALQRIEELAQLPVYRERPVALYTDLYQLTMMYGHY